LLPEIGKSIDAAHPILTDVYYIKSGIDPQSKETKSVLIRRGEELHGPDKMYTHGISPW